MYFTPQPALAALGISSVNPSTISNTQSNTITITGTDFETGAVVSLDTFGPLSTNFFSETTLFAIVPSGLPVGIYSVTVTNPDSTSATLVNALTVVNQTPEPTATATLPSSGYERPLVIVVSYNTSRDRIVQGEEFTLGVSVYNAGQNYATNVTATFVTGNLIPGSTGGVVAVGDIAPSNHADFSQRLIVSTDFWGSLATGEMLLTYTDQNGAIYTEHFTITIPVYYSYSPVTTQTPTPSPSPTQANRPQLVISSYDTDIEPLQPGSQFNLSLIVENSGSATARRVTMIVGGGSSSSSGPGTPDSSGISGASGEFTYFAPIGTSNLQTLGNLTPGTTMEAGQSLIVNVSTNPGAYPMKISFVYVDELNNAYIDEQVITLLVFRKPNVDVSFYRDPGQLFAGQENFLPLQVVNLGRTSVVLGNMQINTTSGQLFNNTILVGTLETGGYFTLDASYIPDIPGTYDLLVTIDYTDDFSQAQVITRTITIDVMEGFIPEPIPEEGMNGGFDPSIGQPETLLQTIWRFIRGLLGLDSGNTSSGSSTDIPVEEPIIEPIPGGPLKGP